MWCFFSLVFLSFPFFIQFSEEIFVFPKVFWRNICFPKVFLRNISFPKIFWRNIYFSYKFSYEIFPPQVWQPHLLHHLEPRQHRVRLHLVQGAVRNAGIYILTICRKNIKNYKGTIFLFWKKIWPNQVLKKRWTIFSNFHKSKKKNELHAWEENLKRAMIQLITWGPWI